MKKTQAEPEAYEVVFDLDQSYEYNEVEKRINAMRKDVKRLNDELAIIREDELTGWAFGLVTQQRRKQIDVEISILYSMLHALEIKRQRVRRKIHNEQKVLTQAYMDYSDL